MSTGPNSTSTQPSLIEYALVLIVVAIAVTLMLAPMPKGLRRKLQAWVAEAVEPINK